MKGLLSLSWINTLPSRDLLDLEASFREEAQPCAGLTGQALSGLEAPIKLGAGDEHLHPPGTNFSNDAKEARTRGRFAKTPESPS